MNKYKKLISDTVVLAIGTFGSKLLIFLLMPLYTDLLSPAEYSAAELITSTANLIIPFACMGISTGIFRFAAEKGTNKQEVFSSSIAVLGGGLAVLLVVGLPFCFAGTLTAEARLVVLYVLFADLQAVCSQYVRAVDRPNLFALQGILNTLLTVMFNLLFLMVFDLGVTGYVLAVIAGNFVTTVFLIFTAKLWKVFRISAVRKETVKELFRFSLPMVPTTVCWLITDLSDRYFVNGICGGTVNGIYSAAYKIPTIVNLVSGIFMQAWQFSAVAQSGNEKECGKFYSEVFSGFLSLIFIGTSGLILLSRFLCGLLLNVRYFEAWQYMPTLLCAAALESVVSFLATVYMVRKKSMHSFLTAMVGTCLNLVLNALMIPALGALGAAMATLIGYAAVYLVRLIDAPRLLPFRLYLPRQVVSIALLSGAAAVMTFDPPLRLLWVSLMTFAAIAINAPAMVRTVKALFQRRKSAG